MKAKDGVYINFMISEEKDILNLKNMIKNYKPISPNDVASLRKKIIKNGKHHLLRFFNEHIKANDENDNTKTNNQKKKPKKNKKANVEKVQPIKENKIEYVEVYRNRVFKASDFQFLHHKIVLGEYTMNTQKAFAIPNDVLKNIPGEYTIAIQPNKSFYFENQGLTQLLNLVEEYYFKYLDKMTYLWYKDKALSIDEYYCFSIQLKEKDFTFNEENNRYELLENTIKISLLGKDWYEIYDNNINITRLARDRYRYDYCNYIDSLQEVPKWYKPVYKSKRPYLQYFEKFNQKVSKSLENLIRKYIYYTQDDVDIQNWSNYKDERNRFGILIDVKFIDEDVDTDMCGWIKGPHFYSQKVRLIYRDSPKGKLYNFGDETIATIEQTIESLKPNEFKDSLNSLIQSVKLKRIVGYNPNKPIYGNTPILGYHVTDYRYKIDNPLLDISDSRYKNAHPKIEDFSAFLEKGIIKKITYFKDPNYMCSKDAQGSPVHCYLLANDKYIALYALDYSKSTYVFKVKDGKIDMAMFLIWSYFSSCYYNKRDGKSIRIETLFSNFGIEYYDNTGSPISKNEERLYQFLLPFCFYY